MYSRLLSSLRSLLLTPVSSHPDSSPNVGRSLAIASRPTSSPDSCLLPSCLLPPRLLPLLSVLLLPLSAQTQPQAPSPAASQAPAQQVTIPLKRLFLADSEAEVLKISDNSDAKVVLRNLPYLDPAALEKDLAEAFGKPISNELFQQVGNILTLFLRKNDRPIIALSIPGQNASDGTLRVAISIGHYKDLQIRGNRWFSESLLREKLGVRSGDEIRISTLEAGISVINNSPFRNAKVALQSLPTEPGKANLIVGVAERIPLNASFSFDNTGTEVLGSNRYTTSVSYANLWGIEHQASYTFSTTDDTKLLRLHQLSYRMPLPRYQSFTASLSRVDVAPIFADGHIQQKGASSLASLRYSRPFATSKLTGEISAGVDFSRSNNNLEWLGTVNTIILDTQTDVLQATVNLSAQRRDKWGLWAGGLGFKFSPGGLGERNSQPAYQTSRPMSNPRYLLATLGLQRLTALPYGMQLLSRFNGQFASTNLLGSEQMSIGGMSSVRGYGERIASGDHGVSLSNELQGPVWNARLHFARASNRIPPLLYRLVGFVDSGHVYYKHPAGTDLLHRPLASAGLGLRIGSGTTFSATCDYGWQLLRDNPYKQLDRGRLHLQGSLSF